MKTIRCYSCDCGEDVYEDDEVCVGCGKPTDASKLVEQEIPEIISQTWACSGSSYHLPACSGFCKPLAND